MGGGGSAYRLVSSETAASEKELDWLAAPFSKLTPFAPGNFQQNAGLGRGKFGLVFLCTHTSGKKVAVKYIPKNAVTEFKCSQRIQQEINILNQINHPFIIHSFGAFDATTSLGLVLEFAYGGELFTRMKRADKMTEPESKFYFCEIALALHYLHDTLNIVYRDLKPENILIDHLGHIKLCDFGFAVPMQFSSAIQGTGGGGAEPPGQQDSTPQPLHDGCGTAMYLAPEIAGGFMNKAHGFPVDWWSLGCVLFEMVTGNAPFGDTDHMNKFEIFNNINSMKISYPMHLSSKLKDLIKGLLAPEASKRYNWGMVKFNEWVADVNWEEFINRQVVPPWVPISGPSGKGGSNAAEGEVPKNMVEFFVKWDFAMPNDVTSEAQNYTKSIVLPKMPKFRVEGCVYNVDGNVVERRRTNSSGEITPQNPNAAMKKQASSRDLPGGKKAASAAAGGKR